MSRRNSEISEKSAFRNLSEADSNNADNCENSEKVENNCENSTNSSPVPEKNVKKESSNPSCAGCIILWITQEAYSVTQ